MDNAEVRGMFEELLTVIRQENAIAHGETRQMLTEELREQLDSRTGVILGELDSRTGELRTQFVEALDQRTADILHQLDQRTGELRTEFVQTLDQRTGALKTELMQALASRTGELKTELMQALDARTDDLKAEFVVSRNHVDHKIDLLADGLLNLDEKIDRETTDIRSEMRRGFAETHDLIRFTWSHSG